MAETGGAGAGELDARAIERVVVEALTPSPDTVILDRPDWVQWSTSSAPDGTANGVYLAQLAADEADARIEAVKRHYLERGCEFRWFVGPSSAPEDLPARLERAGLTLFGTALGMSMRVPAEVPPLPPGVELREVGPGDVALFAEVSTRAWEREAAFTEVVTRTVSRALAQGDGARRSWVLWAEGEAVGVTTLRLLPKIGYFQGAAVVPEHRRAGLYRAMLYDRLALLRRLGLDHAVLWAHERTSAASGRRIGFVPRCRGTFLEWRRTP